MPEGPEVTIIAQKLKTILLGEDVTFRKIDKIKGILPCEEDVFRVLNVENNGKLLWFHLQKDLTDFWLFNTLGLKGGWFSTKNGKIARMKLKFIHQDTELFYCDPPNFGTFHFLTQPEAQKKMGQRGFNLFGSTPLSLDTFSAIVKKPRKDMNVCTFLTKQNYMSGIGNVLKSEILYDAQISPHRTIQSMNVEEIKALHQSIVHICQIALECNGRTSNYCDLISPEECTYSSMIKVYNKTVTDDSDKLEIIKSKTPDKRWTYFSSKISAS